MRICIIAEGSYPYITGGVSSWIHSLITEMPEHEFIVYAIGAETKQKGKFRYKLPRNLIEVTEVFLDEYLVQQGVWGQRFNLSQVQQQAIQSLVSGEGSLDWGSLFDLLRSKKIKNVADFLSSKDYFDMIVRLGKDTYSAVPFTELFWTVNSMILPLFLTIRHHIPAADVYHSVSTGYAGVIGVLAKHIHQKPMLLTEHGIYSREREEEIIKADWVKGYFKDLWIHYFYTLSNCAYQNSTEVITLFERNKEVEVDLGCDEEKIRIIPNGVDINHYTNLNKAPNDGKIRIGAIIRVVPIKDLKTMIQSFFLVENDVPHAELFIMGPTEEDERYYQECLQMVDSLGIKNIHFMGLVNIKEYIGQMDILLLTSISEGQPLAILEGMANSKPFVTTNVGSCRELIEGKEDDNYGPAGFVVPVMQYEQIANAIITLCKDQTLRETMGRNGYQRVSTRYKHRDFINSYRFLYQSLEG